MPFIEVAEWGHYMYNMIEWSVMSYFDKTCIFPVGCCAMWLMVNLE